MRRIMKIIYLLLLCSTLYAQKGVILKPVVDLVGHPVSSNVVSYHNLPCAGGSQNPFDACPRAHQLIYHETVEIIKQTDSEYCVHLPHLFYITANNDKPQSTFWTHKKNITPYSQLSKEAQACIPHAYDHKKNGTSKQKVIVLTKPWYSKILKFTFSIGTRFVLLSENQNGGYFTICAVCPKTFQPITLIVPQSHAMIIEQTNLQTARDCFVKLLRSWTRLPGTIPYIWGGCSVTETVRTGRFNHITINCNNKLCDAYQQTEIKNDPQSGFDCTGLVLRAAQTAGLPYYYKNSSTIATYLKPVTQAENIQEGDLIWIPGHIIIISDLKKNRVIEARHYSDGYGKVHEIKLNHMFKDIKTFTDLYRTIADHKPLYRLNRDGKISKTITQAKILSLTGY